jgi:non-ribosomal peptide synthetase component E (peptide arylation enzyme)
MTTESISVNQMVHQSAPCNALWLGFQRSALSFPDRLALEVNADVITYAELRRLATSLAATLLKHAVSKNVPLTAVFAYRSVTAFAGVLGALFAGNANGVVREVHADWADARKHDGET